MKAIFTKYHGPGNVKGSCISATDGENRVVISRECALRIEESHKQAALALCKKMNWHGTLIMGDVFKSGCVFVWDAPAERIEV